ncbi:MAG TPA: hypothetical protein VFV58_15440 [Blastocatellia bacterium]|jgi:hypothetical protein|nr:hypothetical protein [Blastocatellia bacterium]
MIRYLQDNRSLLRALVWLAVFAAVGAALVLLYHDADQQDSGYHFLFARWAHRHPLYFIGVWARPLFTLLYFPFAQLGYAAAKFFTVIISLATAWQTFRLARQIKFERAEMAIPLLFLQPPFFLLSSTVLTETLFALVFVIALRLHLSGRIKAGMIVASLLLLVRPEGLFIGVLWGVWVMTGRQGDGETRRRGDGAMAPLGRKSFDLPFRPVSLSPRRLVSLLLLATGAFAWWLAAYLVTRDPLWIVHDWPSDWRPDGKTNGTGPVWWYFALAPLIVGPLLTAPFIVGLWRLLKRREFMCGVSAFLVLFVAHSLMFWRGWFGSAGYPRYLVCVSPAVALIGLAGWNEMAERRAKPAGASRNSLAAIALAASFLISVFYVDGWKFTRDARAVDEMSEWFRANERPFARLICSQAYMYIVFDRDQWERPPFTADRENNLELIRQSPPQTLVFWDEETGPRWYGLSAGDFESAGYVRLKSQAFRLEGLFFRLPWNRFGGPRVQHMSLLYKD